MYIGIFGSGLGHATRMLGVSQRLIDDGYELRFSSSNEVAAFLRKRGFRCNEIPLVDVVFDESGTFSAKETAKVALLLFARLYEQIQIELRNIIEFDPEVVLSDSVLSTLIASRLRGVRTVTVLNQLKLISSPKTPRIAAKLLATGSITLGNEFWELSDRILLPDLPPPYTISEENLWGAGSVGARAEYIGLLTPPRSAYIDPVIEHALSDTGRKKLFWQISGPAPTRLSLLKKVKGIARSLEAEYLSIISGGNPLGASGTPQEIEGGYFYEWCPSKDALVDRSDVVISRAGHVSISDFILRGKTSVLIPIRGHSEQIGNARKAERLGISSSLDERDLSEGSFRRALEFADSQEARDGVKRLSEYARAFDAIGGLVSALEGT